MVFRIKAAQIACMQSTSLQTNTIDRLFGWWYAIAAPPFVAEDASLQQREKARRARFMSLILLVEIIYTTISLNGGFIADIVISITILSFVVGIFLNRMGKTSAAGILVLVVTELSITIGEGLTTIFGGGLHMGMLLASLAYIQPNLIAIALFPTGSALAFGLCNCFFIYLGMTFLPKAADVTAYMAESAFQAYSSVISIQILAIVLSFLWANSAMMQMKRADQAEEVNKLGQELAEQQQAALEEKQRLEESIQKIVNVHVQVANGDFNARVPLDSGNILWSVAGSLNNLLARLQRVRQDTQQQQRTEHALQQATAELQQAKRQQGPLRISKTGTAVDLLLAEMMDIVSASRSGPLRSHNLSPLATNPDLSQSPGAGGITPPPTNRDYQEFPRLDTSMHEK